MKKKPRKLKLLTRSQLAKQLAVSEANIVKWTMSEQVPYIISDGEIKYHPKTYRLWSSDSW